MNIWDSYSPLEEYSDFGRREVDVFPLSFQERARVRCIHPVSQASHPSRGEIKKGKRKASGPFLKEKVVRTFGLDWGSFDPQSGSAEGKLLAGMFCRRVLLVLLGGLDGGTAGGDFGRRFLVFH